MVYIIIYRVGGIVDKRTGRGRSLYLERLSVTDKGWGRGCLTTLESSLLDRPTWKPLPQDHPREEGQE